MTQKNRAKIKNLKAKTTVSKGTVEMEKKPGTWSFNWVRACTVLGEKILSKKSGRGTI